MNLTADLKALETIGVDLEDFNAWCANKADEEGASEYFIWDNQGEDVNMMMTCDFLFDKYTEDMDLEKLYREYLTEKL